MLVLILHPQWHRYHRVQLREMQNCGGFARRDTGDECLILAMRRDLCQSEEKDVLLERVERHE